MGGVRCTLNRQYNTGREGGFAAVPRNAFDHIINAVFQTMGTGRIIISLGGGVEAYFDESGTHQWSPVLIVAGYISTEALWKKFRKAWAIFLETHCDGDAYFHAKDRIRKDEDRVSRKAVSIIHKSIVCGLAITMKESDFDDLITPGLKNQHGSAYDFCCQAVYDSILNTPEVRELSGEILYVFEQGADGWEKADKRMHNIQNIPSLKRRYRYRNHVFMSKTEAPPLQAADLLAYLVFRTCLDAGAFEEDSLHPVLDALSERAHRRQHFDREEIKKVFFNSLTDISRITDVPLPSLGGWSPGQPTDWSGKMLHWVAG